MHRCPLCHASRSHADLFITRRMPQSGKLPVLNLHTGQKSGFSPRRGDSLHRFTSNLARPTGTWVRLAVQNFTSIGAGVGIWPQNIKNFHFFAKEPPDRGNPMTDFYNFGGFYTPNYPTIAFHIWVIRFTGNGVIAEKPRVGQLGRIFQCTL